MDSKSLKTILVFRLLQLFKRGKNIDQLLDRLGSDRTSIDTIKLRLASRLPRILQSGSHTNSLLECLAIEMACMQLQTKKLMQSRWVSMAQGWEESCSDLNKKTYSELGRLGQLFGLIPSEKETSDHFKFRLAEYLDIHRNGLGTSRAILRMTAQLYNATDKPVISYTGNDVDGKVSCTAVAAFHVSDRLEPLHIELIDNPYENYYITIKTGLGKDCHINNHTLDNAVPSIIIKAVDRALIFPVLTHKEKGFRILYAGTVLKDEELHIVNGTSPYVLKDGIEQPHGAKFDETKFGEDAVFGGPKLLMMGFGNRFNTTGTCFGDAQFAGFKADTKMISLSPGKNTWCLSCLDADELRGYLKTYISRDGKTFDDTTIEAIISGKDTIGDHSYGKQAQLTFSWTGRALACFTLTIPDYLPTFMKDRDEIVRKLYYMMTYCKSAGVKGKVNMKVAFNDKQKLEDSCCFASSIYFNERQAIQDSNKIYTEIEFNESAAPKDDMGTVTSKMNLYDSVTKEEMYHNNAVLALNESIQPTDAMNIDKDTIFFKEHTAIKEQFGITSQFDNTSFDNSIFKENSE